MLEWVTYLEPVRVGRETVRTLKTRLSRYKEASYETVQLQAVKCLLQQVINYI